MATPTPKNHFKPLTSLRFFAAMHVLAFHNHLDALMDFPGGIRSIIRTGYVSVSLFFVLSGFILAYTYYGGREDVPFNRPSPQGRRRIPILFLAAHREIKCRVRIHHGPISTLDCRVDPTPENILA